MQEGSSSRTCFPTFQVIDQLDEENPPGKQGFQDSQSQAEGMLSPVCAHGRGLPPSAEDDFGPQIPEVEGFEDSQP